MRAQAKLKLEYYPLPSVEARRIRGFLRYEPGPASVLDPCAGTGAALCALTDGAAVRRYGVELDAYRAEEARTVLDEVVQGSAFDTHAAVESFSLVYLNPPYDFEIGESGNERMETLFLEHCGRWVQPGGVLVMVIPYDRIHACRGVLTPHFRGKAIYRLTAPESVLYKQAAVFGVRRARQERQRLTDRDVQQANAKLYQLTRRYEDLPPLPDAPDRTYAVPASPAARLEYRGLPLDLVEDMLAASPAWRQARRVTHAPPTAVCGRPLTPLHEGHVGLLCTAGLLNGVFGEGEERHAAYWESVKFIDRTEEASEDGRAAVTRERERFSQRLTLLYADGRVALLSEKPSGKASSRENDGDAKRAPEDGQGPIRAADP